MKLRLYSVLDSKTATFGVPQYSQTDAAAIRAFSDHVNSAQGSFPQWFRHPEDFSLYFVGEFDDDTCTFFPSVPTSLVNATALKAAVSSPQPQEFNFNENGLKPQVVS